MGAGMIRGLVILSAFAAACFAFSYESYLALPPKYKAMFPAQIDQYFEDSCVMEDSCITKDDMKNLTEFAVDHSNFTNEDELLAALKDKHPDLYEKIETFHADLNETIDSLGDEAKAFAKEVFGEPRRIQAAVVAGPDSSIEKLKPKLLSALKKYHDLSESAKEQFSTLFSSNDEVFSDENQKHSVKLLTGDLKVEDL